MRAAPPSPSPIGEGESPAISLPPQTRLWILSDGTAGHEAQTLGIAQALGLSPQLRRVEPRTLFAALAPYGPIDPRDAPASPDSPIAPPYPNIVIAAGRRTAPYLRQVRRASKAGTFTVFVNDPRTGPSTADLIVAPRHDGLEGDNVVRPLTPANRITPALLAAARQNPDPRVAALPPPRVAFLIGGNSRHYRFTDQDAAKFADIARTSAAHCKAVMATMSRRTPAPVAQALCKALEGSPAFLWDGAGENPYLSMLANAETIIVTADSVNMLGEAAATGAPIYFYEPTGGHAKIAAYLEALAAHGAARRWSGALERWRYEPINSTPEIAASIARAYQEFCASKPLREGE